MEKQIEEMCAIMADCSYRCCEDTPIVPESSGICFRVDCHRCKEARLLINAGYRKQEWISVEERLPTESGKYIVCRADGNVFQAKFYAHPDGKGGQWGTKSKGKTITRWTHMPEPPKGE